MAGGVAGVADPLERITAAVDHAIETCRGEPESFWILFELYAV
jgi:hypothetical protein